MTDLHEKIYCEDINAKTSVIEFVYNLSVVIELGTALNFLMDHKEELAEYSSCPDVVHALELIREDVNAAIDKTVGKLDKN